MSSMTTIEKAEELKNKFPSLTVEIVGKWVWISGSTFQHLNALRAAGLFFSSGKRKWFWNGQGEKRHSFGWTYPKIVEKYGAVPVTEPETVTA